MKIIYKYKFLFLLLIISILWSSYSRWRVNNIKAQIMLNGTETTGVIVSTHTSRACALTVEYKIEGKTHSILLDKTPTFIDCCNVNNSTCIGVKLKIKYLMEYPNEAIVYTDSPVVE